MLHRLMSRLTEAGQRERGRMRGAHGGSLSPWAMLGGWFGFLRPSRLLKLLGSCAVLMAFFYVIEFRAAGEWAESHAGPRATTERIEALTVERLGLTSCPGTRRSCGVLVGKQTLYRSFGAFGTAAIFVLAGAGMFLIGWGLGRSRTA